MGKFDVKCSQNGEWNINGTPILIKRFDDMISAAGDGATEAILECAKNRSCKHSQDTVPTANQLWEINSCGWSYWLRFIDYEKEDPIPELWLLSAKKIGYSFDPKVELEKRVITSTEEKIKEAPSEWMLAHDGKRK